jgi:hypothetical protein
MESAAPGGRQSEWAIKDVDSVGARNRMKTQNLTTRSACIWRPLGKPIACHHSRECHCPELFTDGRAPGAPSSANLAGTAPGRQYELSPI